MMVHRVGKWLGTAAALSAVLVVAAGCSTSESHDGAHPATEQAVAGQPGPFNAVDTDFANHMIPHHQQAIDMAALADTRAEKPEIKELAKKITAAQEPEIAQLSTWLEQWGQPAPEDPGIHHAHHVGMMSEDEMTSLQGKTGADFDRTFADMMIRHHEGAIQTANKQIAEGVNPEAKKMAQNIVQTQQAEITQLQALKG